MATEHVLRLRITEAADEADRAVRNNDPAAYARAAQKYKANDAILRRLEKERNEKALSELEARADAGGELSYGKILRAGIPVEVMKARGWVDIPSRSGMRKVTPDAAANSGGNGADAAEARPQTHEP